MTLHFSIPYRTQWGEDVCVELILRRARSREIPVLLHMDTTDGNIWQTDYRTSDTTLRQFTYRYAVYRGGEVVRREWSRVPRLFEADASRYFILNDFWMDTPVQPWLFDPAFNPWAACADDADIHTPLFAQTIVLRVLAPTLNEGEDVALLGSQPPLGDWRPERALRLVHTGMCEWRLSVSATALHLPIEYKYVIVDSKTGDLLRWEDGDNRVCGAPPSPAADPKAKGDTSSRLSRQGTTSIVRNDGLVRLPPLFIASNMPQETYATDNEDAAEQTDNAGTTPRKPLSPFAHILEIAAELNLKSISLDTLEDIADVSQDVAGLMPK